MVWKPKEKEKAGVVPRCAQIIPLGALVLGRGGRGGLTMSSDSSMSSAPAALCTVTFILLP